MIVVVGYLTINPAKKADAEAAIATVVEATEAEEGCIQYRYATDIVDPSRVNIAELWESSEAMDAHMVSDHFVAFMGQIGDCLGGPAEVVRYDVASSTKLI